MAKNNKSSNWHKAPYVSKLLFVALVLASETQVCAQNHGFNLQTDITNTETSLWEEAEAAQQVKCEISSDNKYSGGKAVKITDSAASLTFTFNVETRGKYRLLVASEGIGGEKTVNCSVNGATTSFKCNKYGEVEIGTFFFDASQDNTVQITPNWTWFNIDYARLAAATDAYEFNISPLPINTNATESAKKLYAFLYENFGQRVVSGMMTGNMDQTNGQNIRQHEDFQAVYKASGYYPALGGFDFMNGTGIETDRNNSWFKQYNDRILSLAKDLWNQGGIPDFSWHWRDPSRTTGEFYSEQAKINFTTAMNADGTWNTSSALYQNIIKDIDRVAGYFLELQQAGVACIFRPLHEANGGWFWWGTQGAEAYKKLFRLVYEEMVNVKRVNNVIWDWNADYTLGTAWCPGEEYFDVISTDIYNAAFDYSSNYPAFDKLKTATEGRKLITLAENGPIPDIDKMADEDAMWSWWMPWYQSWNGGFVSKTSNDEWKKCMSDERTITLDDMPGWDNYQSAIVLPSAFPTSATATYNLFGLPCTSTSQGFVIGDNRKIRYIE